MTHDEARKRAVDAAADWLIYEDSMTREASAHFAAGAIAAYERTMAEAGWRMVRVPDESPHTQEYVSGANSAASYAVGHAAGWNACRAAMLGEGE